MLKLQGVDVSNVTQNEELIADLDMVVRSFLHSKRRCAWRACEDVANDIGGQHEFSVLMWLHQAKNLVEKAEKLRRKTGTSPARNK